MNIIPVCAKAQAGFCMRKTSGSAQPPSDEGAGFAEGEDGGRENRNLSPTWRTASHGMFRRPQIRRPIPSKINFSIFTNPPCNIFDIMLKFKIVIEFTIFLIRKV